jgi:hypothetical protein
MRPFRYTRDEERSFLASSFEPHGDGYVFYRHHFAPGIPVTTEERAEYLRPPIDGSRTAFYRKIEGRAPVAPRRPWLRSQAATLRAIPPGVSIGLVAVGGMMLARSGGFADPGLGWLLRVAGSMALGYGTLALVARLWSRARA